MNNKASPFINPYNFVSYDHDQNRIARQREALVTGYDRYCGFSGKLTCRLKTMSKIFVGGKENVRNKFYRIGKLYAIQGASLKGTLRSVAEAISSACFSMISNEHIERKNSLDPSFLKQGCTLKNNSGLCISCRIFGFSTDGETSQSFAGKIAVEDAKIVNYTENNQLISVNVQNIDKLRPRKTFIKKHALSSPKPRHTPFYMLNEKLRGRKFYYHQPHIHGYTLEEKNSEINRAKQTSGAKAIPEFDDIETLNDGTTFEFTIHYQNLSEKELGLLYMTIILDDQCAHKIGQGKPLGLGSARITVEEILEYDENRYKKIQKSIPITEKKAIASKVDSYINLFKKDKEVSFYENGWNELKAILEFPPYSQPIEYPDRKWFNKNKLVCLPSPLEVAGGSNMLMK